MSITEKPLVSVVVPAYNRAATIGSTLDTIVAQSGWPFEIVVVDDGSSDDTAAIASRHAPESRVIVQENQGRSAARNNGARLAAGDDLLTAARFAAAGGALATTRHGAVPSIPTAAEIVSERAGMLRKMLAIIATTATSRPTIRNPPM